MGDKREEEGVREIYQMRVLDLLHNADVLELDVEVLVYALEGAADLDVVLELDGDLVVDQGLEETAGGGRLVRAAEKIYGKRERVA